MAKKNELFWLTKFHSSFAFSHITNENRNKNNKKKSRFILRLLDYLIYVIAICTKYFVLLVMRFTTNDSHIWEKSVISEKSEHNEANTEKREKRKKKLFFFLI
jgi:hypothetical protein